MKYYLVLLSIFFTFQLSAQDWWTKTKKEAIPADLTSTKLLVQKFKTRKLDDAPPQAFIDKDDRDEHPLIKKTNDKLSEYNEELRALWKSYKYDYAVVSKKKSEDTLKYPYSDAKYVLRHEVYLRRFQKNGVTDYFYTYVYYFHDRENDRDYPYIYLFKEKRLQSVEKLIEYLNTL